MSTDSKQPEERLELDTILVNFLHRNAKWVPPILIAVEAGLCGLIIAKVSYTEIDWTTYMQQVSLFVNGETDYTLLKGDTGPLVYPAFHLYLYSALYYLTDHGTNILRAQYIFAGVYLVTLSFVMACYRRAGAPSWLLLPLILSKRLHSIFLLRLFNDTWATLFLWISIWALQKRWWEVGALAWGFGLGVKMTMLLPAPALAVILIQGAGLAQAFFLGTYIFMLQASAAFPFLSQAFGWTYFQRAFDLGRQFLYKWTVNWRFVPENIFLSPAFAGMLLVAHVSLLLAFVQNRWIKPSSTTIPGFVKKHVKGMDYASEERISRMITPKFVMDAMLTSVAIGMLCARSLHYQFYAYLGWATPYLLWRSNMPGLMILIVWGAQEFYWNIYPSTERSSGAVVLVLILQVMAMFNTPSEDELSAAPAAVQAKEHTE